MMVETPKGLVKKDVFSRVASSDKLGITLGYSAVRWLSMDEVHYGRVGGEKNLQYGGSGENGSPALFWFCIQG